MIDILNFKIYSKQEANQFNPISLAFVGDGVYELYVRSYILNKKGNLSAHKLHIKAIDFVKAKAQSDIMLTLEKLLNEEEVAVYKRGRNAKCHSVPKNADVRDYRVATGFECLMGYLYITNQKDRLVELMEKSISIREE